MMASQVFAITEHVIASSYIREYPHATAGSQEDVLQLCVKQYTPLLHSIESVPHDAVTIIGAHANGFPKELYEPLWIELYQGFRAAGRSIRGIWIADAAHQGQSGVLNEAKLGNDPSWLDHSRDLFLMINHFQAEIRRPIVGVGHSMGSVQLVNLALMHPRLFTSLVVIEPVLFHSSPKDRQDPARLSVVRRDVWPSRADAARSFRLSKFYSAWDPRVLDLWIQFGLRDLPDGTITGSEEPKVTLTTTRDQEVASFLRYRNLNSPAPPDHSTLSDSTFSPSLYRPEPSLVFGRLDALRPSVLYVFGRSSDVSRPQDQEAKLAVTGIGIGGSGGVRKGRVKSVVLNAGHLVPMEDVRNTAREAVGWLLPELELHAASEQREMLTWGAVDPSIKNKISPAARDVLVGSGKGGSTKSNMAKI